MPTARTNRPAGAARPRRLPVIPITIGLVVLLALVAVLASRGGDDDPGTATTVEETRPVTVEGVPLPGFDAGQDPAVGATAPNLVGAGFDGTPLEIAADGRPKVVIFLAHWCPHCQREVPVLAQWLAEHGAPDDVDLYAVATGTTPDRPNYPPSAWLEREKLTVPTLADDAIGSAAQAYGLSVYPFFVALDGDNHVIARATGELTVGQWETLLAMAAGSGTA